MWNDPSGESITAAIAAATAGLVALVKSMRGSSSTTTITGTSAAAQRSNQSTQQTAQQSTPRVVPQAPSGPRQSSPVAQRVAPNANRAAGQQQTTRASSTQNNIQIANRGSTGRVDPNNLNEQLAMQQVQSNPLNGATKVPISMTDSRWLASDGWVKMQNVISLSDGTKINIHFVFNEVLNLVDDFKFK